MFRALKLLLQASRMSWLAGLPHIITDLLQRHKTGLTKSPLFPWSAHLRRTLTVDRNA